MADMTEMKAIGTIHTPFHNDEDIPYQAWSSKEVARIEVLEEYEEGLMDIEGYSHLILIYEFHNRISESNKKNMNLRTEGLLVKPFLDDEFHGVFSTRAPVRPNPIGLSVVELLERDGNRLVVEGADMLDGTPLLDLKPYVPVFDHRENARIGWMSGRL